jgi:hypothetical protein
MTDGEARLKGNARYAMGRGWPFPWARIGAENGEYITTMVMGFASGQDKGFTRDSSFQTTSRRLVDRLF